MQVRTSQERIDLQRSFQACLRPNYMPNSSFSIPGKSSKSRPLKGTEKVYKLAFFYKKGMRLERWDPLLPQVHVIYQLSCIFNFFVMTHRLGCDPLLTLLQGEGKCITFSTKVPAFSVNIYASHRCHGVTVLITTGVAGHSFALR